MISSRSLDRLRLLDLGDDGQAHALLVHDRPDRVGVVRRRGRTTARSCPRAGAAPSAGPRSSFSLSAGTLTATPGRFRPLWLETGPPSMTRVQHVGRRRRQHLEAQPPVVDEDAVARARRRRAARRRSWRRSRAVPGTSRLVMVNSAPGSSRAGPSAKLAEPDLRALEVDEDPDRSARRVRGRSHLGVAQLVLGVRAVAEVQAGDVHRPRRPVPGSAPRCRWQDRAWR